MRTLVHISGILIAASGGLVGLSGCGIGAGWLFWFGLIVFVVWLADREFGGKEDVPAMCGAGEGRSVDMQALWK